MFGMKATTQNNFGRVARAASDATYRNIRHAAFSIGKAAKGLIKKSSEPSDAGDPPTTRAKGGKNLRGAIFTAADKDSALIGPRESWVGDVGEAHEFGVPREGDRFPERPFMNPALMMSIPRFAKDWEGSIGE